MLDREVLNAAPKQSSGDMLLRAPGVYVSRPEGDAVAHEIYLRGFNAAHGQDIEFTVGGVPINRQINQLRGGVDILVNNAGIQHVSPVENFPAEKWDAIIAINLSSAFHTTRLAEIGRAHV